MQILDPLRAHVWQTSRGTKHCAPRPATTFLRVNMSQFYIYLTKFHENPWNSVKSKNMWQNKLFLGHIGQSGPRNGQPSSQTATYQKTEGTQSYLRIWGTYDPIESGPSDPKKIGLYGCSVKKCRFWTPWEPMFDRPAGVLNIARPAPPPLFCE